MLKFILGVEIGSLFTASDGYQEVVLSFLMSFIV